MMKTIRWAAYGLIGVAAVAWAVAWLRPDLVDRVVRGAAEGTAGIAIPGGVSVGGPFTLTDTTGRTVTEKTYAGKYMLVYFGYTFCPDVCPTELQVVASALDLLGPDADRIVPLFVTVDPERDTVQTLSEYVKLFHPRLIGLTGTPAQIAAVARAYRVYYAKVNAKDRSDYLMDHSSFIYLMGPDGGLRALFRNGTSPKELADGIRAKFAGS
jgi:protein SCO1/2